MQNRTRGGRSAAALALTVCQMGRNSVRPVPQEPPILVVTQTLLRPLRPPPPAVVRPLLPPHGTGSSPFIGEEHPPGSPDGHTRHARQPATPAGHGARRTAATSGRRPQAPTGGRRPVTYGRPPRTPPTGGRRAHHRRAAAAHRHRRAAAGHSPTGGRRAHHRRAAAAHTTEGRPPRTPPTAGRVPHQRRAAAAPHQRRPADARKARARHALRPVCGPGGRPALTGAAAAPTKREAGVRRGGATRARGRGDGVGGGYPQFPQRSKKRARPRAYPTTAPPRTGGRWGQGHREKSARKESARTTESRLADVGGCTGLTEPSTELLHHVAQAGRHGAPRQ